MKNSIKQEIIKYLSKYSPALELFQKLLEVGDIYVMGGTLREYNDKHKIEELRDADFAVNIRDKERWLSILQEMPSKRNRFGGHKFVCSGFIIDVWDVRETWAFSTGIIKVEDNDYFRYLPKSVFLNLDALAYDLSNDRWNDSIYNDAIRKRELGIVLRENPYEGLNILRAMILKKRYGMKYSIELANVIIDYLEKGGTVWDLLETQQERYGYFVLSKDDIQQEILLCKRITRVKFTGLTP